MPAPKITIESEDVADPLVAAGGLDPAQVASAMRWGSLLASALFGLVALWAGLEMTRLIEDLFARSPVFGWIGTGLVALVVLAALMFVVREIVGLMRLSRLGTVREDASPGAAQHRS
jgi:putative membrane protein